MSTLIPCSPTIVSRSGRLVFAASYYTGADRGFHRIQHRGLELLVAGEIDFLGIHFLGPERFRARETTVNRLLRKIRTAIVAGRGKRPARQQYFRACRQINKLFGYELTGRPTRCRIGKVRYVQPRQHTVLGHFELILEQMRRVDRTVRKWLRRELGPTITRRTNGRPRSRGLGEWRVRSAARMYEMEVHAIAHAPLQTLGG